MAEIARRRADEFRDFMRVLEFRAIHFDDQAGIAEEDFRGRFHNTGLSGPRGSEEEEVADWASRGVEASGKDLEEVHERLHAFFLANDLGAKRLMEVARVVAADAGVQLLPHGCSHTSYLGQERVLL